MKRLLAGLLSLLSPALAPALAQGQTATLSPQQAQQQQQTGQVVLIDVRTPQEWRQTGLPPGALAISLDAPAPFGQQVLQAVDGDKTRPVALICRSGNRSGKAAALLHQQGFTQLFNVAEGMEGGPNGPGWIKRGLPVVRP